MPAHSERVRRNYHDISLRETPDSPWSGQHRFTVVVTKADIASHMSTREMQRFVLQQLGAEIAACYDNRR